MANKSGQRKTVGVYISPSEICIAQARPNKADQLETEHLVKIPTGFKVREGLNRPLAANGEFFNENAAWVATLKTAMSRVDWGSPTVVVTLSSQFAILRYFVMPLIDRKFWNKSIPLESKKYIPVSFDEVVYDYSASPLDGGKKLGVLFGLTQRKSIEFIINTLKTMGLEVEAVEINACSLERLFSYLDPKDHASKGYVHFSNGGSSMLFSSHGYPVLYREAEYEAGSSMSDRKRLDVKGAVQFVDRYVGGQEYKSLMLSGEGLDGWKPFVETEAPMPVATWQPARTAGIKSNDSSALFAVGASIRNYMSKRFSVDISGISSAESVEKQLKGYAITLTVFVGGLLLALSLLGQVRLYSANSRLSDIRNKVGNAPEIETLDSTTMMEMIEKMRADANMLSTILASKDTLTPKLQAIADAISPELWIVSMQYQSPFRISESQSNASVMAISGLTDLRGATAIKAVENFMKGLKKTGAFKNFEPPFGNMEFAMAGDDETSRAEVKRGASSFGIQCTSKRKN